MNRELCCRSRPSATNRISSNHNHSCYPTTLYTIPFGMALTSTAGNCASIAAPNYTFLGLSSPARGFKSQDTSTNVSFLLTTGCCDPGSALYNDPAIPCIHYCSTSRSNESFVQCVAGFLNEPGFTVQQNWCLDNGLAEYQSISSMRNLPYLAKPTSTRKSVGLLVSVAALGYYALRATMA